MKRRPIVTLIDTPVTCQDNPGLFDSTHPSDHALAARICADCPLYEPCLELLETFQADGSYQTVAVRDGTIVGAHGGIARPLGTWAGMLFRSGSNPYDLPKKPQQKVAQCGTESGHRKHRRSQEPTCKECREAHAKGNRAREKRAKERAANG